MVVCKMRLRVKNALLHKFGFGKPPYFYTPWLIDLAATSQLSQFQSTDQSSMSAQTSVNANRKCEVYIPKKL